MIYVYMDMLCASEIKLQGYARTKHTQYMYHTYAAVKKICKNLCCLGVGVILSVTGDSKIIERCGVQNDVVPRIEKGILRWFVHVEGINVSR